MTQSSSLPVLIVVIGVIGLLCAWPLHTHLVDGPAKSDVVEDLLPVLELPVGEEAPLGKEEQICEQLVQSLGGDHAILLRKEVRLMCGTYPRPEGIEFITEASKTGGPRRVTSASITYPDRGGLDLDVWRTTVMGGIAGLPSLRRVWIGSSIIGDQDLARLKDLPALRELSLACPLTDTGLSEIAELRKLKLLKIDAYGRRQGFTDLALEQLRTIPGLDLQLSSVKIDYDIFSSLENLSALSLSYCTIADEAYSGLSQCVKLKRFEYGGPTPLRNACAAELGRLPHLNRVDVGFRTSLTDECLLALAASRSLEQLCLYDCSQLTEAGFAALAATPLKRVEFWEADESQLEAIRKILPNVTLVSKR